MMACIDTTVVYDKLGLLWLLLLLLLLHMADKE